MVSDLLRTVRDILNKCDLFFRTYIYSTFNKFMDRNSEL